VLLLLQPKSPLEESKAMFVLLPDNLEKGKTTIIQLKQNRTKQKKRNKEECRKKSRKIK